MDKSNKTLLFVFVSVIALLSIAVISILLLVKKAGHNSSDAEENIPAETLSDDQICGNYDIRLEYSDSIAYYVGVISRDITGEYVLTVLSEKAPKVMKLDFTEKGCVKCDETGNGTISYKEITNKTTIRFRNNDFICTMTK